MHDPSTPTRPPATAQAVLLAREAAQGTIVQAVMDLSRIAVQIRDGSAGWSALANQLDALGSEISQAAAWLRDAAPQGAGHDHAG